MIVVRNCFVAKPGNASKLAAMLKEVMASGDVPGVRILTDLTGDFNRVVMEFPAANVSEFEERMKQYATDANLREKMKGYTDLWVTGHREILTVVE